MIGFDVIKFLDGHNIPHREDGPSCVRGNTVLKCPWCGDDDPSQHLSIHLQKGYWNCWRNPSHRGRKPHRLIMRLVGCDYEAAEDLIAGGRGLSGFDVLAQAFRHPQAGAKSVPNGSLRLPAQFRSVTPSGRGRPYVGYLRGRGFAEQDVERLSSEYDLRFSTEGFWHNRIIFPLMFEGELVCWTGRTINPNERLRYLSLSERLNPDHNPTPASRSIKQLIWNYDELILEGADVLAVVEGPFDALKVDFYGKAKSIRASCLFGTGITPEQKLLLADVRQRCDRLVIIPDAGALSNGMRLLSELSYLKPRLMPLPPGVGDPGELSQAQVRALANNL